MGKTQSEDLKIEIQINCLRGGTIMLYNSRNDEELEHSIILTREIRACQGICPLPQGDLHLD